MHWAIIFLRVRDRTAAVLAAIPLFALAFVAPPPRRTIVDGREVVELVLFGQVVPKWLFVVVFGSLFGLLWYGVRRLLDRFWPEKEEKLAEHRYVNPVVKGAWTAKEFLLVPPPSPNPLESQFYEGTWLEEFTAFRNKLDAWLATASDATLGEMLPAARELNEALDEEAVSRLAEAHERRGIPTLDELNALAEEIDNDDLREYVEERREELDSSTFTADRVYGRPDGGFIAWKGDDPEAGSPMDYAPPKLRTALDYLQAEEPPPMRFLLGEDFATKELNAFHAELARWLREATDETLNGLVPAIRAMASSVDFETVERLTDAHETRNIPTLDELSALAEELDNEDLRTYVSERIGGT